MAPFPSVNPNGLGFLPNVRCGLYAPGQQIRFTAYGNWYALGPDSYVVRDIRGNVMASGAISPVPDTNYGPHTAPDFAFPADTTGWPYGWYRIFFSNSTLNDPAAGSSVGGQNFGLVPAPVNLPPNPAQGTHLNQPAYEDLVFRGVCGVGPARYQVQDLENPIPSINNVLALIAVDNLFQNNPLYADESRPRPRFVQIENPAVDYLQSGTWQTTMFFPLTAEIDAAQLFVGVSPGTTTGKKITIYFPDATTPVETYDDITTEAQLIAASASSAYVKIIKNYGVLPDLIAPTAIGRARRDGLIATVNALYPAGVEWFEGPRNEPNVSGWSTEMSVQAMKLMYGYVKSANPNAKVLGPAFSTYGNGGTGSLYDDFLARGGGQYVDGISWHCYDAFGANFDVWPGKTNLRALISTLEKYGVDHLPRWQTEHGTYISSSGLFNAALSRGLTIQMLVQDQFGVPKEQNHYWYTTNHGFWGQDTWLLQGRQSITPMGLLYRTLGEAIFGKTYTGAIDFGAVGDSIFVGNVYTNPNTGAKTVAMQATCPLTDPKVTFAISGASGPLTLTDAWGNTSTVTPSGSGRLALDVHDFAQYLDLPAGAGITVYSHGSWPPIANEFYGIDVALRPASRAHASGTGGVGALRVNDGRLRVDRPSSPNFPMHGDPSDPETSPVAIRMDFPNGVRADRVLVRSGQPWFFTSGLIDFDVQTFDANGSTWTTRATWTMLPYNDHVKHVSNANEDGMTWHEFWGAPYIHDCPFPGGPVQTKAIRLYIRRASYMKTASPVIHAEEGSFTSQQWVHIGRFSVFCDEIAHMDRRVVAGPVDL